MIYLWQGGLGKGFRPILSDFNKNVSCKRKRTREVWYAKRKSWKSWFETDENGKLTENVSFVTRDVLSLKNSFGGAFIGCSNYPDCKFTRPLSKAKATEQVNLAEPKLIGQNDLVKIFI